MSDGNRFDVLDESGPLTPEMWEWLRSVKGRSSVGIARRLRVIASDLRLIADALDLEDGPTVEPALREHASELLEVADWLDPKRT